MMMLKPLIILGAGGFARETLDVIDAINAVSPVWDVLGFLVDAQYGSAGDIVQGKPILGEFDQLRKHPKTYVVCGVGAPEYRWHMIKRIREFDVQFASLVHPTVIRTPWMHLGVGTIITAGCVLSNHIKIGDHVHINPSSTIGHDVRIDSFVSLAPGVLISGNVHIQSGTYVGTGTSIIEKRTVGAWSIIGAGSTVIADVPANTTVVGTPAKVIKTRSEGWYLHENQH